MGLILNVLGIASGFSLGAIPALALMLILMWARNKQRRKRLELIAVRDRSFECWLRRPNAIKDSLSHRWGVRDVRSACRYPNFPTAWRLGRAANGPTLGLYRSRPPRAP